MPKHCADCHDGNLVRAPQRYVLENVSPSTLLAGSNEGWLRAFDVDNGQLLWEFDTTQAFTSVDGPIAEGGSMGGGQAQLVVGYRLILNSDYAFAGKIPGYTLLVLRLPTREMPLTQASLDRGLMAQDFVESAVK